MGGTLISVIIIIFLFILPFNSVIMQSSNHEICNSVTFENSGMSL
jgi:hypothetical protein